ncbi:MAG: hypothetical protein M1358_01705 [Chloroflexi bacterium]|nr:hypothetical protein [Chloroflexota bacterium]
MAKQKTRESLGHVHRINSTGEHESKRGELLATRNHEVIRHWAEGRDAAPVVVAGSEHQGYPGALTFSFPYAGGAELQQVSWEDWFKLFDDHGLTFVYQETTEDGLLSDFFQFESASRDQ